MCGDRDATAQKLCHIYQIKKVTEMYLTLWDIPGVIELALRGLQNTS
jgi:hypothetical protein